MAQLLSSLDLNAKVKFGKHQVNTEDPQEIIWRIVAKNHACTPAYPENSITLHTDKIIDYRAFDAIEPLNPDYGRQIDGNNYYLHSNIAQWLNSYASAGEWYVAKHEYDSPPDDAAKLFNINTCYADRPGFLYYFSSREINKILTTSIRVIRNTDTDGGGYDDFNAKIFLPSITEMNGTHENDISEGKLWPVYPDDNSRLSYVTQQCYDNTLNEGKVTDIGESVRYILRTPFSDSSMMVLVIGEEGELGWSSALLGNQGIRPALNLSGDTLISDEPDSDGCYLVIVDDPPSISAKQAGELGVQSTPLKQVYTISDPDGDSLTVTEKLNGEVIRTISDQSSGTQLIFDLASMWQSLDVDTTHTAVIEVTDGILTTTHEWTFTRSNSAPSVTARASGDLGKLAVPLNQEYTVTDVNDDMLTVTETLDGQEIRMLQDQPSGTILKFDLTDQWEALSKDSPHTAAIEISDGVLSTTRSWTFSVIEPINQSITSNQSSVLPTSVIIPVLPVQVFVTNNGDDDEPVWEDASKEYLERKVYSFKNKAKTADNWCVEVKYTVDGLTIPDKLTTIHKFNLS